MTERQKLLLRLISHGDCTIYGAAANMDTTLFAASRIRNDLLALGLVKQWKGYGDVMQLTVRGRSFAPADRGAD